MACIASVSARVRRIRALPRVQEVVGFCASMLLYVSRKFKAPIYRKCELPKC
jgi:hypothetical protein